MTATLRYLDLLDKHTARYPVTAWQGAYKLLFAKCPIRGV